MFRSTVFPVVLVLVAVVASIPTNQNDLQPVVIVDFNSEVEEAGNVQGQPGEQELMSSSKLTAVPADGFEGTLRYSIGKRVWNDRIVSQHSDKHRWVSPQNVTLILQYPASGQPGAIVTYAEVVVNQSSNLGRATVVTGGIGKRYIAAIVEGNRTLWFNYSAVIYGV